MIDQHLLAEICSSLELIPPKQPANNVHFFDRNRDCRFTIKYNIPQEFTDAVKLKVEIVPLNTPQPPRSPLCDKPNHNQNVLFSCNDTQTNQHFIDNILLSNEARELMLTLRFFCNSGCSTMWKKSQLVFSICNESGQLIKDFRMTIKIGERANRDERICRGRLSGQPFDEV